MKITHPSKELFKPSLASPLAPSGVRNETPAAVPLKSAAKAGHLMPYETAAKAIFVKANGLPAYYKATGVLRNARQVTDLNET